MGGRICEDGFEIIVKKAPRTRRGCQERCVVARMAEANNARQRDQGGIFCFLIVEWQRCLRTKALSDDNT